MKTDMCTFMIISRETLLRMRTFLGKKKCRENENINFNFQKLFFRKSCRWRDNVEKYGTAGQATDSNIIRRMRFACWINKDTSTHSEYVIIIAFPQQVVTRTYISRLVSSITQTRCRCASYGKWHCSALSNLYALCSRNLNLRFEQKSLTKYN
jgi:hypothetical protein